MSPYGLAPAPSKEDLALLRRFEPVIRYTRGERFFPMDVERYIQQCSLWVQHPENGAEMLIPQGELTVEKLIQPRQDGFGAVYFLKLIEPLDLLELARYSLNEAVKSLSHDESTDVFRAGRGRLARVGLTSRFVDALFSITLFLRGRVPGDTAAAAALTYQRIQAEQERYCYYGRVVRENGWVALQYWFFYPFNNWRSGFFGLNDHEGDWEMITIYCYTPNEPGTNPDEDCPLVPQWVAYSSHDFWGDDLRRRWDDPEVEKVVDAQGFEHPVIYSGAGSHASYFSPGEYLTELELPFLAPVARLVDAVKYIWVNILRQAGANPKNNKLTVFTVPFVDYARGDGLSIGPGQNREWTPSMLTNSTSWAVNYRGLWGLYARDPIAGENAPAGPVYNRDGSVRRSWYDPLGWAGLDKVPPPDEALEILWQRREQVRTHLRELQREIASKSAALQRLGVELAAMEGVAHMEPVYESGRQEMAALSGELAELRRQFTVEQAKLEAFDQHERRLRDGHQGPLRGHIRRAHLPSSDVELRLGTLAEGFAAVSIGLVMIGIVLLIVFAQQYLAIGLAVLIGLLVFVEAGFRRRLSSLISSLVIGLAVVSALVLIMEFFWQLIVALVLSAGLYIMWENIREIRA